MKLTWLDNNSWFLEISGKRILLDPWLVGPLVFGNLDWLFKGVKSKTYDVNKPIDLILLSQGLDDHAHIPTLEELDHNIPVVASPNATKVVKELGYTDIRTLDHGDSYTLDETVHFKAFPGSLVGPQLVENAYIINDLKEGQKLYYEPHGNHCSGLQEEAPVDIILTPVVGISILHLLPVLQGQQTTLKLCQTLKPKFILPTADAKETEYQGLLVSLLRQEGTIDKFRQQLQKNDLATKVMTPKPGETIDLTPQLVN
ncbi:unknown [Crocosphaera subtropica ATCC 51142]|uniref:Metallo-beta-lactamase domain-containing protein n=1 Tax=Crocosphaera subtropica (strain ATCC 51142 / BH68) TaxID=43989 RepID=B1WY40_CROS5|nr:MBL fold metallo-hydrolase [Crocosphaera subtropica]ACB52624.1 unknown [Crocosphaera subtropica ATCC 51142]